MCVEIKNLMSCLCWRNSFFSGWTDVASWIAWRQIVMRTAVQSESVGKENWEGHTELDDVCILGQEMLWKCTKRNLPFSSAMTPGMVEVIQMFWRRDERSWTRHFTQFLHDFTPSLKVSEDQLRLCSNLLTQHNTLRTVLCNIASEF